MTIFLSKANVLRLHEKLIDSFGGAHGVRDDGLLISALAQPQVTMGGQLLHATLSEQAAAYLFHLIKNHALSMVINALAVLQHHYFYSQTAIN